MRISRILKLAALSTLIILGFYLIPPEIPMNHLKPNIIKRLANEGDINLKIFGNVHFTLLPSTSLIINQGRLDIDEKTQIEIPKLTFKISLKSLFTKQIIINDLEITGAQFNLEVLEQLTKNIHKNKPTAVNYLQNISFNNVNLVLKPTATIFNKVNKISGKLFYTPNKSLRFNGSFDLNEFKYFLNMDLATSNTQDDNSSILNLSSNFINVDFRGNLKNQDSYDLNGKVVVKFFDKIHDDIEISTFHHSLLQDNITINSDIKLDSKELNITNLKLSSNNISKVIGDFKITFGSDQHLLSTFEGDSINLDKMFADINKKKRGTEESFTFENFIKSFLLAFNFSMPDDIKGLINLKFREIIFNDKSITNIILTSTLADKKAILDEFSIALPDQNSLHFTGILSHNEIRPKFDGKVFLDIFNYEAFSLWLNLDQSISSTYAKKPLSLKANLSIIPRNLRLDDANIIWDTLKVSGKFGIKHTGDKRLSAMAEVRLNSLSADDMLLSANFDEFIALLYAYDYDKTGAKFYEITNDFKWLRAFPFNLNLDLLIDNLKFKSMEFPEFYASIALSPNNFSIEEMAITTRDASIKGSASLITSSIAPKITANIIVDYITKELITKIMPSKDILISKQAEVITANTEAEQIITKGGANFYSVNNIIGDLKLSVKQFISPTLSLQNLNLNAQSQDGVISISDLEADIFKGKLNLIGNITIFSVIPSYTLTFAFNNFLLGDFLKYYANYNSLDGYISINGSIVTKGADLDTTYANLAANMNLLGKKITWSTFNIGEIMRLSEYKASYNEKNDKLRSFVSSGESLFDDLKGTISITHGLASLNDFKFNNNRATGAFAAQLDVKNRLISTYARVSFIPIGRASVMSIDITGSGPINALEPKVNYQSYLNFLKNDQSITTIEENFESNALLRNRILR